MIYGTFRHRRVLLVLPVLLLLSISPALAQSIDSFRANRGDGLLSGDTQDPVAVTAEFAAAKEDQPAGLFITATMEPGWHIYSLVQQPPLIATRIELDHSDAFRLTGDFRAGSAPKTEVKADLDNLVVESHYGVVTWYAPIELTAGADPSAVRIRGTLTVQPCDAGRCEAPRGLPFVASLGQGMALQIPPEEQPPEEQPPVASPETPAPPETPPIEQQNGELPWRPFTTVAAFQQLTGGFDEQTVEANLSGQHSRTSLVHILQGIVFGFVGGLILNVMPCVLPVIGLKVLSFVEQAGHDRRKALMLNVWYSAGLISVFVLLATLAVVAGYGWGQLFSREDFNIGLAAVVFVMGLSFLGVWELPIPGFAGSGKAGDLAAQEGATGAFAKGVLTTVLATPCSAPFLAPALTWAIAQPPQLTYVVFISAGLGMASPYLLIGAFPRLIGFLPKPGAWMETFKQIMGFVLLGTVVFIFTFMELQYVVPTIGLLFGLWAACWWIGRTPPTANRTTKMQRWAEAAAFAGVVWLVVFPGIGAILPRGYGLPGLTGVMQARLKEKINVAAAIRMAEMTRPEEIGENTVLVDFTADWCLTCKTLELTVLNTHAVREVVDRNRVITLKADWTRADPEVTRMLELLGSKQVPTVAIFPAGDPNRPIVLRGGCTQRTLLKALNDAGPSKGV